MKFLLGKKLGMTTLYDAERGALNVTLLSCEPNTVTGIRTTEKDGYSAVQCEFSSKKQSTRREFRNQKAEEITHTVGDAIDVEVFQVGDTVCISGVTKAKGFQGVVKRHGFAGSPKTHGHRHDLRAPGSIGSAFPQHVLKGVRMAGRMGGGRKTVNGLQVVVVDKEKSLLAVRGAVPGKVGTLVEIVAR